MATDPPVRFSTANVNKSKPAQSFSWENPVPVNRFWDSLDYCRSRNFLGNFTEQELQQLPIDPDSDASNKEKFELLLQLLQDKVAREEAADPTLHDTDYKCWNSLWQGVYTMQAELNLPEAEQTLLMLVDRREESNIVPPHMLADHFNSVGKYAEAEATERPVCAWMDNNIGNDSPQALNARRIIAKALWRQGTARRSEAQALIDEIRTLIEGMGEGKFGVYQEEERRMTEEWLIMLSVY